jgi:Zn-finger nucleic acid-binding protein
MLVTIDDVNVDQCLDCSGIWFDFDELRQILERDEIALLKNIEDNNEGHDVTPASCPRCGGKGNMVQVVDTKHGFHIDTCPVCYGKWLDGGEYERLKNTGLREFIRSLI